MDVNDDSDDTDDNELDEDANDVDEDEANDDNDEDEEDEEEDDELGDEHRLLLRLSLFDRPMLTPLFCRLVFELTLALLIRLLLLS